GRQPACPLTQVLGAGGDGGAGAAGQLDLEVDAAAGESRTLAGDQVRGPHPLHPPRAPRLCRRGLPFCFRSVGRSWWPARLWYLALFSRLRRRPRGNRLGYPLVGVGPLRIVVVCGTHGIASSTSVMSGRCAAVNQRPTVEGCTPSSRAIFLFDHPCPRSFAA